MTMNDDVRYVDEQSAAIAELETPVIQVWDGVLALPLIGTLDTSRSLRMTERLLERIVETGSEIVLLDITGVPIIDSAVARHLLETISAARLLGAEVMVVGLTTSTAMTLVHLGLDLTGVTTRSTMARGLALAFDRMGLEVTHTKGAVALAAAHEEGLRG